MSIINANLLAPEAGTLVNNTGVTNGKHTSRETAVQEQELKRSGWQLADMDDTGPLKPVDRDSSAPTGAARTEQEHELVDVVSE